ncbi:MAG: peptidylprolyl isomerase [Pyrinomonadaceae bacterium]
MKFTNSAIFLTAFCLLFLSAPVLAQESETKVVDEVVAQVNDSVITLSRINREVNGFIDSLVQEGKPREQATTEVEAKRGEIIANLINEELLVQKAKEYGFDSEVEAQINQSFLKTMRELNLKSLDELYQAMTDQGVNPEDIRDFRRKEFTKDLVFQREVDARIYNGLKPKEIKAYYEAHKAQFTQPETVTLSMIFLKAEGNTAEDLRAKANQLIERAKKGEDFVKLALENSDDPDVKSNNGKAGTFNVKDMDDRYKEALKNVKVGDILGPFGIENVGLQIIKIDAHQQASDESVYNENEVRKTMTIEKIPDERKQYLVKLREESYIKFNDKYRPLVAPILYAEERKAETEKSPGK